MSVVITARNLLQGERIVDYPVLILDDGYITQIGTRETAPSHAAGSTVQKFPGATLVPSYLDIHVHGAAGYDVMDDAPEALATIGRFLASRGVGGFLPTTVTSTEETTLRALDRLADNIEGQPPLDGAVPLGIHLEGPFLARSKCGVHPESLLARPSIQLFDRFWAAARGHIRLMTIAPELEGATELIEHASALGVRCSLGHSNATAQEAEAGFHAGARSATHTFNAMRALGHRDPGLAGYVLDNGNLFAEIICDGIHVDPAMVRLFFKAKGPGHSILITDGISAAGRPDGEYKLGGLDVHVERGRCTLSDRPEVLAGSVLTLDLAIANFASFTHTELPAAVRLGTYNPARLLDLDGQWGVLGAGREANITVLSPSGEVTATFRRGLPVAAKATVS